MKKPGVVVVFVMFIAWAIVATVGWMRHPEDKGLKVATEAVKNMWKQDRIMEQARSDRDTAITQTETAIALAAEWQRVAEKCLNEKEAKKPKEKHGPR